jgi:hypothetical protein
VHTLPLLLLLFAAPTADAEDSGEAATAADESGSDDGELYETEGGDEDPGAGPPGPKPPGAKGCAVADPGVLGLLALAPLLLRRRARR